MAQFLIVITLRETNLDFVCFYLDCNIVKVRQFYISREFDIFGEVIKKRGMFTVVVPSAGDRRVTNIWLVLRTWNPRFTKPS
jgi:hypothetical protein